MAKKEVIIKKVDVDSGKEEIGENLDRIMELRDNTYIRHRIEYVTKTIDDSYFELAGLLFRAFDLGAHQAWGYTKWKDYIEEELGMSIRKAQFLMSIWNWFYIEIKDKNVREKIKGIGWTKVKEMVGVVDESNIDEWAEKAKNENATDFAKACREVKGGGTGSDCSTENNNESESIKKLTFTLMGDQYNSVDDALNLAKEMTDSDKSGNLITLICVDFLTSNIFAQSKKDEMRELFLSKIEDLMDINIIAHSRSGGGLVYGNVIDTVAT